MLDSTKIQRRQSEVRQELAELAGAEALTDEQRSRMDVLDREYGDNERRLRAALIAEDEERREAGRDLETREDRQWGELVAGFELRQVALHLDEGRALSGQTGEVVTELRNQGGYRGIPVPLMALETRAGETVAGGTPDPITTRPVIDRLFPSSVAAKMGVQMIQIGSGATEWPVTTSSVTAGWADGETANVPGPTVYATTDRALKPDHNLGIHMRVSRKALLQSGEGLEQAIRRDMAGTMAAELDKAIFNGTGANGQPLGVVSGASTYGIANTDLSAAPTYADFLAEIVAFMSANTITTPGDVRALMRPELFGYLEGQVNGDLVMSEYHRLGWLLVGRAGQSGTFPPNINVTSNALPAPTGSPEETTMLFTTATGGVAPAFVGMWGAVDMIRDPYSDAQSGGLRLTALTTADVTVARPAQLRVVSGMQV